MPVHDYSLIDRLQALHSTEIAQISDKHATSHKARRSLLFDMLSQYSQYLNHTWGNVFRSIIFLSLNPIDLVVVLAFAIGGSTILGMMLITCFALNHPAPVKLFASWGGGLSVVNAASNIFRQITQVQVDAARMALERGPVESKDKGGREFNIDIAKLLLQFSALMYERGAGPIYSEPAISSQAHARGVHSNTDQDSTIPSASSTIHNLVSPQNGGPLSDPAELLAHLTNTEAAQAISEQVGHSAQDSAIRDFCRSFGLDYAPVSELNAGDSAYVALFWDPSANWIVVAFKGTSPTEYAEWVSDFNYNMVDARDWLPGFEKVHGGFLRRIFPDDVSLNGGVRPWDTILAGIRLVSGDLRKRTQDPNTKINVYFTGHSLGCSTASLAYARALLVESDLGENIVLRDGYLFAAPIVCGVESVTAFDGAINKDFYMPKTLWRVTNMRDIVATGLPDYGDMKDSRFSSNSLLNFAHLGAEIQMRSKPDKSIVAGWPHITRGLPVAITSSLPGKLVGTLGVHQGLPPFVLSLERLPILGRFFQHSTGFYWDQLQRVGAGLCQWIETE